MTVIPLDKIDLAIYLVLAIALYTAILWFYFSTITEALQEMDCERCNKNG